MCVYVCLCVCVCVCFCVCMSVCVLYVYVCVCICMYYKIIFSSCEDVVIVRNVCDHSGRLTFGLDHYSSWPTFVWNC